MLFKTSENQQKLIAVPPPAPTPMASKVGHIQLYRGLLLHPLSSLPMKILATPLPMVVYQQECIRERVLNNVSVV